jgi:hypothetical protein
MGIVLLLKPESCVCIATSTRKSVEEGLREFHDQDGVFRGEADLGVQSHLEIDVVVETAPST